MDFTVRKRKHKLINFMKNLKHDIKQTSIYDFYDLFPNKIFLNEGVEGLVVQTNFIDQLYYKDPIILKKINLLKKDSSLKKMSANDIYKKFLSKESFKNPIFIEILSNTLINQLILQKICPNFTMNYYWDFIKSNDLVIANEFANLSDFDHWAQQTHSDEIWFNAFFQISMGILSIQKYFNMVHSDLHPGNILVQKVKPGGYWVYLINNFKYYVPNYGYQFLLHDFGFAWVENTMYIDWHYNDTLQYITKNGWYFYDINSILTNIFKTKYYKVPKIFINVIKELFKDELLYIFSKDYYSNLLNYTKKKQKDKLLSFIKSYPDITLSYKAKNLNLYDKIFSLYYDQTFINKESINNYNNLLININYSKKPLNSYKIESYSLHKNFDKLKLPKNLMSIVN